MQSSPLTVIRTSSKKELQVKVSEMHYRLERPKPWPEELELDAGPRVPHQPFIPGERELSQGEEKVDGLPCPPREVDLQQECRDGERSSESSGKVQRG